MEGLGTTYKSYQFSLVLLYIKYNVLVTVYALFQFNLMLFV